MSKTRLTLLVSFGVMAAAQAWQGGLKLPAPFHTPSSNNPPHVIGRPDGVQLRLPPGFRIEVYADGFEVPRFMLEGPSGEILLSDSADNGSSMFFRTRTRTSSRNSERSF